MKMLVFFQSIKSNLPALELNSQDTVEDVKKKIETAFGFPAAQQRLIHRGICLKDETTLEENNVPQRKNIFIMLSKPGASSSGAAAASDPPLSTTTPAVTVSSGHPYVVSNASDAALAIVRKSRQFQQLNSVVKGDPKILQHSLQEVGKQNPNLVPLIQEYQADLMRLINESVEGEGGNSWKKLRSL